MSVDAPKSEVNINNPYDAFINDLQNENVTILGPNEANERFSILRNPNTTPEEKTVAYTDLCASSLRLIPYMIKHFAPKTIPPEELVGEAYETIANCIENYDPDFIASNGKKGTFVAYVVGALGKHLGNPRTYENPKTPFKQPQNAQVLSRRIRRAWEVLAQELGRTPSTEEIYSDVVEQATPDRENSIEANDNDSDLQGDERSPYNDDKFKSFEAVKSTFVEPRFVPIKSEVTRGRVHTDSLDLAKGKIEETISDPSVDVEKEVERGMLKADLGEILDTLDPRERMVISLYYGLDGGEQFSLKLISDVLHTNIEKIREIRAYAMRKLRHPSQSRRIRDYL